jgi:ribosomal protein L11 methyltransferase
LLHAATKASGVPLYGADDGKIEPMREYPALRVSPPDRSEEFADLLAAAIDDFAPLALEESDGGAIVAYFGDAAVRPAAAESIRQLLPGSRIEFLQVPDENWAERSQASLKAVRVLSLTVAPPWDAGTADPAATIVILPSMGFGTGHHATTCLCLRAMQELGVRDKSLIDIGTGSGVLALAALKLGAPRVVAVDNDPDAVANANENAVLNRVELDVRCGDLGDPRVTAGAPFDIAVANLTGATLSRFAAQLDALAPRGILIVSGIREEEEAGVRAAFSRTFRMRYELEGWLCLVFGDTPG